MPLSKQLPADQHMPPFYTRDISIIRITLGKLHPECVKKLTILCGVTAYKQRILVPAYCYKAMSLHPLPIVFFRRRQKRNY